MPDSSPTKALSFYHMEASSHMWDKYASSTWRGQTSINHAQPTTCWNLIPDFLDQVESQMDSNTIFYFEFQTWNLALQPA